MEWINVEDKLPKQNECVLFVERHSGLVNYGFYEEVDRDEPFIKEFPDGRKICFEKPDGGVWWRFRFADALERKNVSHWMPLPTPPMQMIVNDPSDDLRKRNN